MARLKNFFLNLSWGYFQIACNVFYSLASVPLILHYLPTWQLGLWATISQVATYLSLVDFGMTAAFARLLIDQKNSNSRQHYSSLISTSFWVSVIQGLVITGLGWWLAPFGAGLLNFSDAEADLFVFLFRFQVLVLGISFLFRPLHAILYAHQMEYVSSLAAAITMVGSLALLAVFFAFGWGPYSLSLASLAGLVATPLVLFVFAKKRGVLHGIPLFSKGSWMVFREIFSFGKDVFYMGLGHHLILTSQTIIVSRSLGLESAAAWAVGTKMFNLVLPLTWRPYGAAIPGMSEMLVQGERGRLQRRLTGMISLTFALAVFFSGFLTLCNSSFVQHWTGDKIHWAMANNFFLSLWLLVLALQTTHCNFVSVTKNVGALKYLYFLEGAVFICISLSLTPRFGFPGLILSSLACTLLFSYQYSLRNTGRFFGLPAAAMGWQPILPGLKYLLVYGLSTAFFSSLVFLFPADVKLLASVAWATLGGGGLFWTLGVPIEIRRELWQKLSSLPYFSRRPRSV